MNFEEFCRYVKDHIQEHFPESYQNYNITLHNVTKVNKGQVCALTIWRPDSIGGPTYYLEQPYEAYRNGVSLDQVVQSVANMYLEFERTNKHLEQQYSHEYVEEMFRFPKVREQVVIRTIGYTKNHSLLEQVPHKVMGDLAATYRVYLGKNEDMEATSIVTNEQMKQYGITLEELHEIALKNSMRVMPAQVVKMEKMLGEVLDGVIDGEIPDTGILVVTNKQACHGAAVAFYPDVFEKLGIPMDQYYVAPSSVHELILLPKRAAPLEAMNELVKEVNLQVVADEEVLSDQIHEYDPASKKLVIGGSQQRMEGEPVKDQELQQRNNKSFVCI